MVETSWRVVRIEMQILRPFRLGKGGQIAALSPVTRLVFPVSLFVVPVEHNL